MSNSTTIAQALVERGAVLAAYVPGETSFATEAREWLHLYETDYARALYKEGVLTEDSVWFTSTPLSYMHHWICRGLLDDVLARTATHPKFGS